MASTAAAFPTIGHTRLRMKPLSTERVL